MYSRPEGFSSPLVDASSPVAGAGASSSLTYEPFYGLREKPFSLSADPRFLFRSPAHAPAFDELLAGIRRREGLIVLTGEIGTGKTTLCRSVLQHLDRRTFAAFVADPFVSREDLLKTLLADFGVISIGDLTRSGRFSGASRSDLSFLLYEFLDSLVPLQAFAVLVIDEAQNLSLPLLEEIRILSELERREKLLQVVLVGQPELRASLKLPQMRQVDQRVSVRCELKPLDADGVAGYVNHRLHVAGHGEPAVDFTKAALEAIHQGSSGVPRLINRICDRALQQASLSATRQIDTHFIWTALDDLGLDGPAPVVEPAAIAAAAPIAVAAPIEEPAPIQESPSFEPTTPFEKPLSFVKPSDGDSEIGTLPEIAFGGELDFAGAPELAAHDEAVMGVGSIERSAAPTRWIAWAGAAVLAAFVGVGAVLWYARAHTVDAQAVAPPPSAPAATAATPAPVPVREADAVLPPVSTPAAAPPKPTAAVAVPAARGGYTILVASFKSGQTAARVVQELTSAGLGAQAVQRDFGPARGRFMVVMISGYTSATDVQRDLQKIRALPGGYADARIVEHE